MLYNKYITAYGRRKVNAILKGMPKIFDGDALLRNVVAELRMIRDEERLYRQAHSALKERMRSFYPRLNTKEGRAKIREDIERELDEEGTARKVPHKLFEKTFLDFRKESFYLNHLLPIILEEKDIYLREDFFKNSGLDRFYIETVEKEYFNDKGLDASVLQQIREGEELLGVEN